MFEDLAVSGGGFAKKKEKIEKVRSRQKNLHKHERGLDSSAPHGRDSAFRLDAPRLRRWRASSRPNCSRDDIWLDTSPASGLSFARCVQNEMVESCVRVFQMAATDA